MPVPLTGSPKLWRYCSMLVTSTGRPTVGPRTAAPTMPVVEVLTPSMEGAFSATSSR
jgi:hypothetical protein